MINRSLVLALLLAAFCAGSLPAASLGEPDTLARVGSPRPFDTLWSDTRTIFTDGWLIFSSPAHFNPVQWAILGGTFAGSGLVSLADDPMRTKFMEGHDATKDAMANFGDLYGVGLPTIAVSGGMYLGGLIFDAPWLRRGGLHVFQSALYAGVVTTVLKYTIGRHRPFLNEGVYRFTPFAPNDDHNSFPSGHTTLAFALSSSLAAEIDHPAATVVLYGLATLTACSRIYHDRHWLSDTFMGACIGTFIGYATVHLHDPTLNGAHSFRLLPSPNGITAVWCF